MERKGEELSAKAVFIPCGVLIHRRNEATGSIFRG